MLLTLQKNKDAYDEELAWRLLPSVLANVVAWKRFQSEESVFATSQPSSQGSSHRTRKSNRGAAGEKLLRNGMHACMHASLLVRSCNLGRSARLGQAMAFLVMSRLPGPSDVVAFVASYAR